MKKIVFIVLLIMLSINTYGQVYDDFSDFDFSNNPEWIGDTEKFIINENQELQLYDSNFNNPAYISTACNVAENAFWSFDIRMDFNPSSSNYMEIFLISDTQNPTEATKTYFLRVGGNDDNIVLYKKFNGNITTIISGTADVTDQNSQELHIEVEYQNEQWELNYDNNNMANETFFAMDEITIESQYTSLLCYYTSTRKDKFFIDNIQITGNPYQDFKNPEILQCNINTSSSIYIAFDETLMTESVLKKENYLLNNNYPRAISTVFQNENAYILHFENDFPLNSYQTLHIENIADLAGNTITPIDTSLYKSYCFARDIVFTEILADPNPPVLLAEFEYLEIYNRTDYPIPLNNYQLHIDDQVKWFPDTLLLPKTYAILCHENAKTYFPESLLCIPFSSFSIKNEAATIVLKSNDSRLIDDLYYTVDAYNEDNKSTGGWSLEKIDVNVFCDDIDNWTASSDQNGGTPGKINAASAVNADHVDPTINTLNVVSAHEILLSYNERLTNEFQPEDFRVNFQIENPKNIEIVDHTSILLLFENAFKAKTLYELSINNMIEDCNGNTTRHPPLLFAIAETLHKEDLIINEILFNPYPDGIDFIEIYNKSNKVVDLAGLRLARYENKLLDQLSIITEKNLLLYPGEYRVLCTDSSKITPFYQCNKKSFIEMNDFPSLPDDEGSIALCFPWLEIIDSLYYNEDMHFSHLNDPEGVSLERIHQNLASTQNNWHSTSFAAGFATPSFKNSQQVSPLPLQKEMIRIVPKIISPNNDGYQDYLSIYYTLQENDVVGNLFIYNRYGGLVRQISNHLSLGAQGMFRWDATDQNGQLVQNGIYIIVFESINEQGTLFSETKTCVVRKQ